MPERSQDIQMTKADHKKSCIRLDLEVAPSSTKKERESFAQREVLEVTESNKVSSD